MCCRISKLGVAQGSGVTRAWPTRCCCEHTHVRSEKTAFIQGCTQGSKVVWGRPTNCCCKHTHVCVAESHVSSRLAPRIKKVQELGRPNFAATRCCCEHTHVMFRKNNPFIQGCTQGSKVVWGRPTNCCRKHTHVCVAESHVNSRLAPRVKKVQEFGRPTAAASIHICVSETVPGCTQGSQVTRDWPTNCENMSSQSCTQGPRDTSVWPTMCCCEHTHV